MQGTPTPPVFPPEPGPIDLAAWRAEVAAAKASPWLASLLMRRLGSAPARLAELRGWLAALPRRLRRGWARRLACGLPLAALALALAVGEARAATITVDPGGSGCTLEDAITAANTDTATGNCPAGSGPDDIGFNNANTTYALFTNYGGPLPQISTDITIQGNGNTTLDGEGNLRSFDVTTGGDLTLSNVTITGGNATVGGGINVYEGELTATNVTIQGNYAADYGGGLHATDSLISLTSCTISGNTAGINGGGARFTGESEARIRSSRISGNYASDSGGGLDVDVSAVYIYESSITGNTAGDDGGGINAGEPYMVIESTTISGNVAADYGGGIDIFYGFLAMLNVTISGNTAATEGGGIASDDAFVQIDFSTITGNSAGGSAGGIYTEYYAIRIRNSIVALQTAGANCAGVAPNSFGYNIESGTDCGFTNTGDQQMVSAAALNLGALAPNAPGTTETHALGAVSAARDQIPSATNDCGGAGVTEDQRGVTRPQSGACDVGAYEAEGQAGPTPAATTPPTAATITHFAAAPDPTGRIRLAWETASEVDLAGFRVERAEVGASMDPDRPSGPWSAVGDLIPARGGASAGGRYTFADTVAPGAYAYRLVVVNAGAPPDYFGPVVTRVEALRAFLPWAAGR